MSELELLLDQLKRFEHGENFTPRQRWDFAAMARNVITGMAEDWQGQIKDADRAYLEEYDKCRKLEVDNDKLREEIGRLKDEKFSITDELDRIEAENNLLKFKLREMEELRYKIAPQ